MKRQVARATRGARSLALYLFIPALGAIAPLIAVPAITSRYGASGWAVVAVAVSVGSTAGVICDLGWGVIGPQRIAREPGRALEIYAEALGSKFFALAFLGPACAILTAVLVHDHTAVGVLVSLGTLLGAVGPSWFFIGQGRPGLILWTDTVPRLVIAGAAAAAIALGAPLLVYGLGVLISATSVVVIASSAARLPAVPSWRRFRQGPGVIAAQFPIIVGSVISTAFTSAPASILAFSGGPGVVAAFSAVDRPMRIGLNVLSGVPARLQSWVGTPDPVEALRRSRRSIVINLLLGVVAFLGFVLLAPPVAQVLFAGEIAVGPDLAVLGGLIAAEICFSRGLGLALVAAGRANSITVAVGAGAVVGVALLLGLPRLSGAAGGLQAIFAAEAAMILVQLLQLRRAWRSAPLEVARPPAAPGDR